MILIYIIKTATTVGSSSKTRRISLERKGARGRTQKITGLRLPSALPNDKLSTLIGKDKKFSALIT